MRGKLLPPDAKAMEDLYSKILDLALKLRDGRKFDIEVQRTRGGENHVEDSGVHLVRGRSGMTRTRYEPKAGDLLSGPDGETLVIGDVNVLGGVCDDCKTNAFGWDLDESLPRGKNYVCFLSDGWTLSRNILTEVLTRADNPATRNRTLACLTRRGE